MKNKLLTEAFQAMLNSTKDMVFVKDADLIYVAASMPFVRMVGKKSVDEIVGHTDIEIFEDENLAKRYVADDRRLIRAGDNLIDYIEPITDEDGHARYGSTSKYILKGTDGEFIGILGITRDITRDYVARQHYQRELKYLFELPADTYAVSYIDVDSWRLISQRRQLINASTLQACLTVEDLTSAAIESIVKKDCSAAAFYRRFNPLTLTEIYQSGRSTLSFTYQRLMSDGTTRWVRNDVRFLTDVDSGHLCVMLSAKDIDAQKQEEQRLLQAARMDKMTMLLNRETTMDYIRQTIRDEADQRHVLFMIDVDNFKSLNDTLGHQAGDEFLIALSKELKRCFRESDVVGRVGGDEFFALMKNVSDVQRVRGKAQDLLASIQKICANYSTVSLSASIGIGLYPENGRTLNELYAEADKALYHAKWQGKNQFVFAGEDKQ